MAPNHTPDYAFWVKKENWTVRESTLLLHGLDPLTYRALPLERDVLPGFEPVAHTYLLLGSVAWCVRYPHLCLHGQAIHPMAVMAEALKLALCAPQALLHLVIARCTREKNGTDAGAKENPIALMNTVQTLSPSGATVEEDEAENETESNVVSHAPLTTRERHTLLKTVGILVYVLFVEENTSPRYYHNGKLNAYQVAQKIREKAEALDLDIDGLKSVNRKITEAFQMLGEENGAFNCVSRRANSKRKIETAWSRNRRVVHAYPRKNNRRA